MLSLADLPVSLTARVLDALQADERAEASRLIAHGDGRTRDLASEFRMMHKGLGVTMRVALAELSSQALPSIATTRVLRTFHRAYLQSVMTAVPGHQAPPEPGDPEDVSTDEVVLLLEWAEREFARDQSLRTQQITVAIDQGEDAREAVVSKRDDGFRPVHDALIDGLAAIFSAVVEAAGADATAAIRRFQLAMAEGQRRGFDDWEQRGSRHLAESFAHLLVQHLGEFEIEEQEDGYVFEQALCGSGGRLIRDGRYDGEGALQVVRGPSDVTAGQETLPAYCTHCPMWNTVAPLEWYGHEHVTFVSPARPDGGCTLSINKFDRARRGE